MTRAIFRSAAAVLVLFCMQPGTVIEAEDAPAKPFPAPEKLDYHIEWHLITAGTAQIDISPIGTNWQTKLQLQSAGMVTKLYPVDDNYRALTSDKFCGINATLDAKEGKRHRFSTLTFDNSKRKVNFEERDLLRNQVVSKETDVAPCTHEVLGALTALRIMHVELGKAVLLPITDGKKTVMARIEAQAREKITVDEKPVEAIRYEAFLFDNVLYQRKGRLWIWITDDGARIPVQMRVRLGFPIGSITLTLDKHVRS